MEVLTVADHRIFGGKSKFFKRLSALLLCNILVISNFCIFAKAEQTENPDVQVAGDVQSEGAIPEKTVEEGSYEAYLKEHEGVSFAGTEFTVDAANYSATDQNVEILQNYDGSQKSSVLTPEEGYIEWEINVPETGMYNINIKYYPYEGKGSAIERILNIEIHQLYITSITR
jgi:hypothetical protein